jgi:hypothetical protein
MALQSVIWSKAGSDNDEFELIVITVRENRERCAGFTMLKSVVSVDIGTSLWVRAQGSKDCEKHG